MDLERSLANMGIDDGPWKQDPTQGWSSGGPAGPSTAAAWGHLSPQQSSHVRNVWQDPSQLAQNVNEALGLGGGLPSGTWSAGGGEVDFQAVKHIWQQDAPQHVEPPYGAHSMHPQQQQRVSTNGLVDGMSPDFMRHDNNAAIWDMGPSNPLKPDEPGAFWKQPAAGGWPQPNGMPRWSGQPGAPMPPGHVRNQPPPMNRPPVNSIHANGGWPPNGMVGGPGAMPKQGMWEPPRMRQMPAAAPQARRYPDVTVPPPMEVPGFQNMSIRGGPPQATQMWKDPMSAGGMRQQQHNSFGASNEFAISDYSAPYMAGAKTSPAMGQFSIGGADDLMWHDPNGDLKKWQRDTGVSAWGEPEKAATKAIKLWTVPEGEDEELESALLKCPVPQKKLEGDEGSPRTPLQVPPKRPIIVTGWGELPENDPNKQDDQKWAEANLSTENTPWYMPSQNAPLGYAQEGAWSQGGANLGQTEAIAEKLRVAVEKGYLDMSNISVKQLPAQVLTQINALLSKIPELEAVEKEMNDIVEASRPEGDAVGNSNSPQRNMNEEQKIDYNRLIIQVTTLRIELGELSKKITRNLIEAGIVPAEPPQHQDQYYSFLD